MVQADFPAWSCTQKHAFQRRASNHIIKSGVLGAHQVGNRIAFQIVADELVQTGPHRVCAAADHAGAGRVRLGETGDRRKLTLRDFEDTADGELIRFTVQPIAASLAAHA